MVDSEILNILNNIHKLLLKHRVEIWADYFGDLVKDWEHATQSDQEWKINELILEISELFGGMGSFNDLVICRANGDFILAREEESVNKILRELRSDLYILIGKRTKLY